MLFALVAVFLLPSFPEQAKWLKGDQRAYLFHQLKSDHGQYETEKVSWRTVTHVSKDWVLWLQGTVYCLNVGTANAIGFFSPTIITVSALLRTSPSSLLRTARRSLP